MVSANYQDIGVVGSPSTTTEFTVDLLQEATEERMVGALVAFDAVQSGSPIKSVGQVVGIELRNRWHEDATFRNLIKRTGEIPPITSRQDTRTAQLAIGATFRRNGNKYDPDLLGMVPPTGTRVSRVDQPLIDSLLAIYQDEVFYLGKAYANDVLYPMWFKHFGSGPGGAGEAYHAGVFGKTGSGKSGLAKMLLLGYARHPEMGILVIDPQGEFSQELSGTTVGQQGLPVRQVIDRLPRPVQVYSIRNIQLNEWDLFEDLLVDLRFTSQLKIPVRSVENARNAAKVIRDTLEKEYSLDKLESMDVMRCALNAVIDKSENVYARERAKILANDVQDVLDNNVEDIFDGYWRPLTNLFSSGQGRRSMYAIVRDLAKDAGKSQIRPIIVVDLSERGNERRFWTEGLQKQLIKRLLDSLVAYASQELGLQESANVLVILDEAARLAPSGTLRSDSDEQLRITLRNAARETRKYGIGWFFISQTLGGIDNEILQQLRILFFGFGLALGDEFRKLREFAGGDRRAMELYQSFRDPHSAPSPNLREFPFMAVGPVSPLSFSGRPLFFSAFTDSEEFLNANGLSVQQKLV